MSPLRVAVLAHVRHPIRPPFEGGMEAHTWHLARGLAARGHHVTLYASGDSDASLELVPIVDTHYERRMPWAQYRDDARLRAHLDSVHDAAWSLVRGGGHDVIHYSGLHPLPIARARAEGVPMLASLHVPPFARLAEAVNVAVRPHLRFSVTSARQRDVWIGGGSPPDAIRTVANGIDPAAWPYRPEGDGSAVWAGRITPNKGAHLAAAAAHRAGIGLTLVGALEDRDYFRHRLVPELHGKVRYAGHLDGDRLSALVGRASVSLFTPLWEEPFGLVAIEAMASGTPVAYIDRGAAREVVGEAGVAADGESPEALAAALERARRLPRELPRRRVETRFTLSRMLDGYEALYRECIDGAERGEPRVTRTPRVKSRVARCRPAARPVSA